MPFNFNASAPQPQGNQPPIPKGFDFSAGAEPPDPEAQAQTTVPSATPSMPFMAEKLDPYGRPYYGEGFKGYTKKLFANIFDPSKLVTKPTQQQLKLIEQAGEVGKADLNKKGWGQWVESWTGISAEDVSQAAAGVSLAMRGTDEEGQVEAKASLGDVVSTTTGILKRGAWQTVTVGLDALGLLDKASRKVQSFNAALDDIGDASSVLPDITRSDEQLKKMFGDTPATQRLGNIINAANDLNPVFAAYNLIRAGTAGQSMYEKTQTVKDNLRASDMIYSMYWENAKKDEYFKRVQAGENPDMVMMELENPWVELAGSILGDPSTYLGLGIIGNIGKAKTPVRLFGKTLFNLPWEEVSRLPTLTELVGIKNIGKARLLRSGESFTQIANPDTEKAFKALGNVADEAKAPEVLRTAVNAARQQVQDFSRNYGVFTLDSKGKAETMKKTVGTFFQVLSGRFRNPDDIMETFKSFRNITNKKDEVALRAFSHLKEVFGTLPFSEVGMQSMEFMGRLIDEVDITAMVTKHGNDIPAFTDEAMGKLNGVVDDMFPSVNDMAKAAQEVKTLGKNASERQKFLAKSYDDLAKSKPTALWANNVNNAIAGNKIYQGLQGFYAGVLMGMRPAYAQRNLISNTIHIWHDLGGRAALEALATGEEVFLKSAVGRLTKQDWVAGVVERESARIKQILGFVPTQAAKGVGTAEKGSGFIAVGQDIEKVHSMLISRYVVESEMEKALRYGGVPDVSALNLPKEAADSLLTHAMETYGNVAETLKRFRADQATGYYETWRHLELDPKFKDTLRRSNLLDELESIRKSAPDPVTFSEQMDQFVKKIDDLAARTADEPALVSAENPASDIVVTIEKAFDEGGRKIMSEEELNQFRALTELRDQLRNGFQDYVDTMRDRVGRLLPPEAVRPFEQRFSQLRQTLSEGNSRWRNYADEVYNGVYAQSKKGTPPAQLWNTVRSVAIDIQDGQPVLKKISLADAYPNVDPTSITNREFEGHLWKWFKETQSQFWRGYTQDFIAGQSSILDEMATTAGVKLDDLKLQEYGDLSNPRLQQITDLTKQIKEWESHLDYSSFSKAGAGVPEGTTLSKMDLSQVENFKGGKSRLFNAVNADRAAQGLQPYATIEDVPFEEAARTLKKRTAPLPPYVGTTQPTVTRQLYENMKGGLRDALEEFKNGTLTKWGEKTPLDTNLGDEAEAGLSKWASELDRRMVSNRAAAAAVADETRNFILHDYNKTYADRFASYFLMYHYWGSRNYARWGERVLETPGTLATYAKWKQTMEKVHSDQPEFYRYNIPIGKLPGMNDSPMYFNLEAALNPLYSLTGVDFNDQKRRVDWASSAIDDMGKFGFNTSMPIQWLMAFNLYKKGEDEAARRWLGRMIPATQDLKAGLNLLEQQFGIDVTPDVSLLPGAKYGEFDPFVNMQGGLDPYEEKRIGRSLADMVLKGEITPEQSYDIMYNRSGPEFDAAVQKAILERAPGQMASYFGGVGFKTRTEGDLKVEEFYGKYYQLLAMRENISPEDYKNQLTQLQGSYQFADTVLLAAKGGDERDAVYAYNVLGRIPPGDSSSVLKDMGLDESLINKFYQDKGDFSEWTPQDKERFMGAMLDIGATYALPDDATRQEWNEVKGDYQAMQEEISKELGIPYAREGGKVIGRGVWDLISTYYDLKDTNKDKADEFKAQHPEIDEAFGMMAEAKISDPLMAKYYVSLDTIESYYAGKNRAILSEKFGKDISDKQQQYFDTGYEGKAAQKAYLKAHPELIRYRKEKKALESGMNSAVLRIASQLPQAAPGAELREDFEPQNATQELLAEFAGQQVPSWQEVSAPMSGPLQKRVQDYWYNGTPLPNAAIKELEYLAKNNGYYNADDMLRQAGYSLMQQGQGLPQQTQGTGNSLFGAVGGP